MNTWQQAVTNSQIRVHESYSEPPPQLSGRKRKKPVIGADSLALSILDKPSGLSLQAAPISKSGLKPIVSSSVQSTKLQTVAEVEAIFRLQHITTRLVTLYLSNPKEGIKAFNKEHYDKRELLKLVCKELPPESKLAFCRDRIAKDSDDDILRYIEGLIDDEIYDKGSEDFFGNYDSPAFLVMRAFLEKTMGDLETNLRCIFPYTVSRFLKDLKFVEGQVLQSTEHQIRDELFKKLATWTNNTPHLVKELNSCLREIGQKKAGNIGAYRKAGSYKFAFIPFFHIFVLPQFKHYEDSSDPARIVLVKIIKNLTEFLNQLPDKFDQIKDEYIKGFIENITEPHSLRNF